MGGTSDVCSMYLYVCAMYFIRRLVEKADSTLRSSRAVPHPSTNRALRRLTSEVRRDPVHSTRYGRQRNLLSKSFLIAGLRQSHHTHSWLGSVDTDVCKLAAWIL